MRGRQYEAVGDENVSGVSIKQGTAQDENRARAGSDVEMEKSIEESVRSSPWGSYVKPFPPAGFQYQAYSLAAA